jgi:hypothetical protein
MSSEKYALPECLKGMNDLSLNMNPSLTDTLKSLLAKYPYIYVRYMLDKTVTELNQSAADNTEQLSNYDAMIKLQTWAKKE